MLFSDVEGSTRLLAALGDQYGEVLSAQRRLLREAFGRHHGTELGTEGDSFFLVFASAADAVAACADGQRALAAHAWPGDARPQVRMGLHTGEPVRHEDGYIGMDVHRAARIAAAVHGGQVVLSDATHQLVAGRLPGTSGAGWGSADLGGPDLGLSDLGLSDLGLQDLGWHRLKDIAEPERLYQLLIPGLRSAFPPLRSLGNRSSLPEPPTPFIARAGELQDVRDLLAGPATVRLVTVTGPGGVGKSRLALAAARAVGDKFPDGVYFVPLAPVTEAAVMWTTIAETLGVTGEGRSPPAFFERIAHREALLVLDNLEQLPAAGEVVAELIRVAPRITVLATSRRPLHVPGEHEYPVRPLPVRQRQPPDGPPGGAVELFVEYAQMARPDFRLTAENTGDVVAICDRLDGLPLALELAAARIRLLSPHALLGRLDRSLEFEAGSAGRPERQRSLRDTVAWSYQLLDDEMQAFFRRLAVFSGGADLEAVAMVAADGADALDGVAELADAGLLTVRDGRDGEPRVGMLQTVRVFALDRLADAGEFDAARSAHASCYAATAEAVTPQLRGPRPLPARDRLETELENVRFALGWCLEPVPDGLPPRDRVTIGLRLCRAMSWFWYAFGYTDEGRRWQRRAVDAASVEGGPELATALHGLAVLLLQQGETAKGRDALTACLEIWRRQGDLSRVAIELSSLGVALWTAGDLEAGRKMLRESIEIAVQIGDEGRQSTALSNLGMVEVWAGNAQQAIDLLAQAQAIDERLGDVWGCAIIQSNLAGAMLRDGRPDDAYASLAGQAAGIAGLGDIELTIEIIELFAAIFAQRDEAGRAARLLGTAEALREQAGMPIRGPDAELLEEYVAAARDAVSAPEWDQQRRAGRARSAEAALADALGAARAARGISRAARR
jgi:predicted ATPase/class 3 adenylate cyclase